MENQETQNEILLYEGKNGLPHLEVQISGETVWLIQNQLAKLFQTSRPNITMHIKNIFDEGELSEISVCKESLHTASYSKNYKTKSYNLDLIDLDIYLN